MMQIGEPRRVLIVDDEHVVADTLAAIFSSSGYQARAAYSAEEALHLIPVWMPELAIVDVYLPKMNGIELAILLRAQYPKCRLSLFSGQAGTSELIAAAEAGGYCFEVLAKPIPPAEMLRIAAGLLAASS
jgi:CheY-like chemotaxis protein